MHNSVLLHEENSRLRAENARQKKKRARRAFIQTGGTITIGEGIGYIKTPQDAPKKGQGSQKPRQEVQEVQELQEPSREVVGGEAGPSETTAPTTRKRAPPRCSACGSTEHNARKCPCK